MRTALNISARAIQPSDIDHPPYSPDLAPCDFWLFDYIKERLDDEPCAKTLATFVTNILLYRSVKSSLSELSEKTFKSQTQMNLAIRLI